MLGIRHYKKAAIDLYQGDITAFVCDAMGNAANNTLVGGGGVDGAIHGVGGPTMMAACRKLDGCPTGQAVVTTAGELPASHVIHAVGPVWEGGDKGELELLYSAYMASLRAAEGLQARHLALPSLSTGVYGFPVGRAAPIAMDAVRAFFDETTLPRALGRVTFVLFSPDHYEAFQDALFQAFPDS